METKDRCCQIYKQGNALSHLSKSTTAASFHVVLSASVYGYALVLYIFFVSSTGSLTPKLKGFKV